MSSSSETPATSERWCGWLRHGPRQCWRLAVTADSEDEARALLHQRCIGLRSVDVYLAREGIDPNDRRA